MKNKKLNFEKDFSNNLDKLTKNHKVFIIQSQIWSICNFYKIDLKFAIDVILKKLVKISKYKTILLPAFSNDFAKKRKYDLARSIPNTGALPIFALKQKIFYRSQSPLHGFLVLGKNVKKIIKIKGYSSWGKGSLYEWMEKNKALWISINLDWSEGCAFHHRSEEIASVPYRKYIVFRGKLFKNGKFLKNIYERKYSYSLEMMPKFNWNKWKKAFKKGDTKVTRVNKALVFRSAQTNLITKRCVEFYKKRPYGSVENKKEIKRWLEKSNFDLKKISNQNYR